MAIGLLPTISRFESTKLFCIWMSQNTNFHVSKLIVLAAYAKKLVVSEHLSVLAEALGWRRTCVPSLVLIPTFV